MAHDDHHSQPGTVGPAKTHKAGCGIRYEEGELRESIDFSGARQWLQENAPAHDSGEAGESGELES